MRLIRVKQALLALRRRGVRATGALSPTDYWTSHNVTAHTRFATPEQSFAYLDWRNAQYYGYIERMPVSGHDGKVILDYGCGPGNDLVGFGTFSAPRRLIGADVSSTSLQEATQRLALHGIAAQLIHVDDTGTIPLDSHSVDYIHCSGVLHHIADPGAVLREFRRVLAPGGAIRVMVYNYDSLWLHLYVAYLKRIFEGESRDLDIRQAFSKTTDGPDCPIADVYKTDEFLRLAQSNGLSADFLGAGISMWEMSLLPRRFEAIMSPHLEREHRSFLIALTFDEAGYPLHNGCHAGVDGCYLLVPAYRPPCRRAAV